MNRHLENKNNIVRIIGDIHGRFNPYREIIKDASHSIQVGDYGIGFTPKTDSLGWYGPLLNESSNHKFIRGNHDNPKACDDNVNWISDGTSYMDFFCVGGAYSIDKHWRIEGRDYWPDEELTMDQWNVILDAYAEQKPDFVISHDGPDSIVKRMFHEKFVSSNEIGSFTRKGLDAMLEIHVPKFHFFGHWHDTRTLKTDECTFVCLGINEYFDFDIDKKEIVRYTK